MTLPIKLNYSVMEAQKSDQIPIGHHWQYEPKWDGFRCLAFKDGGKVWLQSKAGLSLARYFPEVVSMLKQAKARTFVIDGELILRKEADFLFESLQLRIHPSATRIKKLSADCPATFVMFDLLVDQGNDLLVHFPLSIRQIKLEGLVKKHFKGIYNVFLSPRTDDCAKAKQWLRGAGVGMDGIVAKRSDMPYQSGDRHGMLKIKNLKTADCIVGGFRYGTDSKLVGSLLLGLYDDQGLLNHVGFTSSFRDSEKTALTRKLVPLIGPPGFTGKAPGGPSRWSTERSSQWLPLKKKLVVEVQYDHFTGDRFRHGTKFLRWRTDKRPSDCVVSQVAQETIGVPSKLMENSERDMH